MPSTIGQLLRAQADAIEAEARQRASSLRLAADQADSAVDVDAFVSMADAAKIAGVSGRDPARAIRDQLRRDNVPIAVVCGSSVISRRVLLEWLGARSRAAIATNDVDVDYERVVSGRTR